MKIKFLACTGSQNLIKLNIPLNIQVLLAGESNHLLSWKVLMWGMEWVGVVDLY